MTQIGTENKAPNSLYDVIQPPLRPGPAENAASVRGLRGLGLVRRSGVEFRLGTV